MEFFNWRMFCIEQFDLRVLEGENNYITITMAGRLRPKMDRESIDLTVFMIELRPA